MTLRRRPLPLLPLAVFLLVACAAVFAPTGNAKPPIPHSVALSARIAPGDSVQFTARWQAPELGRRHLPIESYQVVWTLDGEIIATHEATGTQDSLRHPIAPVNDSIGPFQVAVRSRDTRGVLSTSPATSALFWTSTEAEPPPPPEFLQVDERIAGLRPRVFIYLSDKVHVCDLPEYTGGGWSGPLPEECDSVA